MTNGTLKLELPNTAHRGEVAGYVVLGAAVCAGFLPLAADRIRLTIARAADLATAELVLSIEALPGQLIVSMEGGGAGWNAEAARLLADHAPAVEQGVVRVVFRRPALASV
ncbi:MAG: hypothetical protein ACXVYV_08675 [Gaiellales bacterium]